MNSHHFSQQQCIVAAGAVAAIGYAGWWLYRRRQEREMDVSASLITQADEDFQWLAGRVAEVSEGKLRLIDTIDRGRCLVAAQDLAAGCRIRDIPVIPHGSDKGLHFSAAVQKDLAEAKRISSSDLLAALDFLASLVAALAENAEVSESALRVLWLLYCFPGDVKAEPMIRRWHKRWEARLAAVPVELVEQAWRRVVPNWRNLLSLTPDGRWYEDVHGVPQLMLGHDAICGLWMLMALCEHSCDPSCALSHDGCDLWFTIVRPIQAGEAVTTSYLTLEGLDQPAQMRQDRLQSNWGFHCACARCSRETCDSEVPPPGPPHSTLFRICGSPPDLNDQLGMDAYGAALRELRGIARGLFRGAWEPISHSLLFMETLLLPDSPHRDATCCELLRSALSLCGGADSDAGYVAGMLQHDAAGLLRRVVAEASSRLSGDRQSLLKLPDGSEYAAAHSLQQCYHQYFICRTWARCCVNQGSGGFYVATAVKLARSIRKTS